MSAVPLPEPAGEGPRFDSARRTRRRIVFALFVSLMIALFVPPYVNLKRFRARLEGSIGGALGRKVTFGAVSLRLLPRPGFDVQDFVVYDDPTISAEPMLRAETVTASLRLTSLWGGRLEIASLSLRYTSLNLVRAVDGRWNVEGLLARASQVPTAPTALARAEARPRFPYIEAAAGRINFKLGQEKKAFALTDAEFSLWLAQEDEWNMRLNARPVRTDFNLSDTGRIRVSGTFRRAGAFRETPVSLHLTLERAQLGQLTTLVYDRDRGWRGSADVTADLAGTPAKLQFAVDARVDDFRRYDIMSGGPFALRTRCTGNYSVDGETLSNMLCIVPAGDGQVTLRGQIVHLFGERQYGLSIAAKDVPMQEVVRFAQHAKRDLPADLGADGDVDAAFALKTVPEDSKSIQAWTGGGSTNGFVLRSQTLDAALELGAINFSFQPTLAGGPHRRAAPDYQHLQLEVASFPVALGGAAPASVHATVTRAGYSVSIQGDADLRRLLRVAQGLGVPAPRRDIPGAARVDLDVAGAWAGFGSPLPVGTVQLKNVTAELPGVAAPLHLSSAVIALAPDRASITNIIGAFENLHLAFGGGLQFARRCDFAATCIVQFDLRSDQLSTDELNRLLNPQLRSRPWYQFVSGQAANDIAAVGRLRAEVRILIGRLLLKSVVVTHVSAQVKLGDGHLLLSDVRGELFGGKQQGRWQADFSGNTPAYSGTGTLDGISLAQISTAMRDNWASGTAHATYQASLAGWNASELLESLSGMLDFQWRDGVLRHLSLRGSEALRFPRLRGHAAFDDGKLTFTDSSMDTASGIYEVTGTASLARELDLKLTPRIGPAIAVEGTLQKPQVSVEKTPTEAALRR